MRYHILFSLCKRSAMFFKPLVRVYPTRTKCLSTSACLNLRIERDEGGSDDETYPEYDSLYAPLVEQSCARDLLYKNSKNLLLQRIYNCVSIQELFNVLNSNLHEYSCPHLAQTVLVLYDLKRIYHDMNNVAAKSQEFLTKLQENASFQTLLQLIEAKIERFDDNALSYTLLYLRKLGLPMEELQVLSRKLEGKLLNRFSIGAASRFLEAVFEEVHLKSYFMSQNLIPLVLNEIDACSSAQSLNDLTVSLNKLHNVVTDEQLEKYKARVEKLMEDGVVTCKNYKVILQIIALLNYPKWREKNSVFISRCILLIKNNLGELDVNEIILLYDVFFKIQEPGEILSSLQRCSSKYFHQLDETVTAEKVALFSTIIYFASPNSRNEFQKILKKYVKDCDDFDNLVSLRKLLSYIKVSDINLCHLYWDKIVKFLKNDSENVDLIKLSHNYINFNLDIDNYRHPEFEKTILGLLENLTQNVIYNYYPQKMSNILSFVLLYGNDLKFLNHLVQKLEYSWELLKYMECLKLSHSLFILRKMDNRYPKLSLARRIDKVLDKALSKEAESETDLWKNNALLKCCIFKNTVDASLVHKLLMNYKDFDAISAKNIENISYCFLLTNSLIPEVLDNIVDYIVTYKDHVLGFHVGKAAYLCYCLGYAPKNPRFFEIAANIIIRDQERMSGLSLIHSALALCFFNKLPDSLIKSIFNVEFMDRLDHELQICYSKDTYPQRVRNNLMQLNRAVCLDYPQCSVPWFHQKYTEENTKTTKKRNNAFASKIKEYLMKVVQRNDAITENVVTPYGYVIDFVICLNSKGEVAGTPAETSTKLALLLFPEFYYTRVLVQVKGSHQMKMRHLEMLGYKVVMVSFSDWVGLFFAEERIEFLTKLIWPIKEH